MCFQDVLDLKDRRWQPRQKVEGPKKISEVHQDAMRQQQQTEQRNRDENRRGGGGGGGGGGGRRMEEPSPRGGGGPSFNESRMMSRDEVPTRTVSMARQQSSELSLRPGNTGGGGYGRGGGKQAASAPSQQAPARGSPQKPAPAAAAPPPPPPPAAVVEPLSEDKLKQKGERANSIYHHVESQGNTISYNHHSFASPQSVNILCPTLCPHSRQPGGGALDRQLVGRHFGQPGGHAQGRGFYATGRSLLRSPFPVHPFFVELL